MISGAPQNTFAIGDTYGWPPPPPATLPNAKPGTETPGAAFHDLLDAINPLEHIPIVSSIYRAITGSQITAGARVVGDTIYGGVFGFISAVANTIAEAVTGKDIGGDMIAYLGFGDESPAASHDTATAAAAARAAASSLVAAAPAMPAQPAGTPPALPNVMMRPDEHMPGALPSRALEPKPSPSARPAAPRMTPLVARDGRPHFIPLNRRKAADGAHEADSAFRRLPKRENSVNRPAEEPGSATAPGETTAASGATNPAPPVPAAPPPPLPEAGMMADENRPLAKTPDVAKTPKAGPNALSSPVSALPSPPLGTTAVPVSYSAATSSLANANYAKALELSRAIQKYYQPETRTGPGSN